MNHKNSPRKHSNRLSTPVRLGVIAVAACFLSAPALSNPLNPAVVNGAASFNQAGKVLTVTNSPGAIINWQKFSIQAGETTHFAQTAASSSVLNRVLNDPTAIYGTLSSNGRVWLVNPAGIMVGPGGKVDVAGFVASTLNISNADFLAGRSVFINDGGAGNVINQGEIRTPAGGSVYLIGSNVTSEGLITTPQGETILAAGATVSLVDSATPGVKVDITGTEGNATNLGTITAEAGRIGIAGVIVRNSGQINASSVVEEGGRVFLKASQDAYVDGNGRIVTTGTRGGSVEVLGNRVAVTGNAEIDASGMGDTTANGGSIKVGGDYQGKNPDVQNANVTYFGPDATLKADAGKVGAGGTVIVWADDTTRAYGNISAKGGALGGDGGFVETSGKSYLAVDGVNVDTRAPQGKTGTWLLDPSEIFIYGGAPDAAVSTTVTAPSGILTTEFTTGATYGSSTISDTTINTMLDTTDVIIHTAGGTAGNGNINVTGANIYGGPSSWALTLAADGSGGGGDIIITNSDINVRDGVTLLAGWNGVMPPYGPDGNELSSTHVINGTGDIKISGSTVQSSEWAVNLWAGRDIILGSNVSNGQGTWIQGAIIDVVAGNNLTLLGGSAVMSDISASQGPGVMLRADTDQTIIVGNQILLQAGSANNTVYAGNYMGSGSVRIESDGSQTISANAIKIYAGTSGHDNMAGIGAYGSQSITVYGGGLELKGGGDSSAAVYGGQGSFNNSARIQHGQWESEDTYAGWGDQTITIYNGGSVNAQAGSGTGVLGYYDSDCYALLGDICRGGSNDVMVENRIGWQTLTFTSGGSLTVTGGNAGIQNWAGIENSGSGGQAINGNPNITLNGGGGGGSAVSYGSEIFDFTNDAGIYSGGGGDQYITAGALLINGGNATYGGAGIGNDGMVGVLSITTLGDMSMYGGTSNADNPYGAPVYIHREGGGEILLEVGGNLYVKAGSGSSAPAIIGSIDGPTDVSINAVGNVDIIAAGSGVAIGSYSGSYGAEVNVLAGGNITVTGNPTAGVLIGSISDAMSPTYVGIGAGRNLIVTDSQIGTPNSSDPGPGVELGAGVAFEVVYGGIVASPYGGNLALLRSSVNTAGHASLSAYGSASITDSVVSGNTMDVMASGDIVVTATGNAHSVLHALGDQIVMADGNIAITSTSTGSGGNAYIYSDTGSQTIGAYGDLMLSASASGNGNRAFINNYGGSAQTVMVGGTLALYGGAAGYNNNAYIQMFDADASGGTQSIVAGNMLLDAGGSTGSYNNGANILAQNTASQAITLVGVNANVTLRAGDGTGIYGGAPDGCSVSPASCSNLSANNSAQFVARGSSQTIDFQYGGSLNLLGGTGGNNNQAVIYLSNATGVQTILGAPDINLSAGSGGVYIRDIDYLLGNHAQITSNGAQGIVANNLNLTGGSSGASRAQVFAGSFQVVDATGNVNLTGGSGSTVTSYYGGVADATPFFLRTGTSAMIRGSNTAPHILELTVGGDLAIAGGSGTSGIAFIGNWKGPVDFHGDIAGDTSLSGNTGGALIGSAVSATTPANLNTIDLFVGGALALNGGSNASYGTAAIGSRYDAANVLIDAGSVALTANSAADARIGSTYGGNATYGGQVSIQSDGNIALTSGTGGGTARMGIGMGTGALTLDSGADIISTAGSVMYGGGLMILAYGDAIIGSTLAAAPGSGVLVNSGYGNPSVATNLSVANVSGDQVELYSTGNVAVNGTITAAAGALDIYAGDYQVPTIGNIALGGNTLSAFGGVTVSAHGDVSQTGGSIMSTSGSILIVADDSAYLNAPISGAAGVDVYVGYNGYGGDLTVAGNITSPVRVNLYNSVGSILQTAGTIAAPAVMIDNTTAAPDKNVVVNVINAGGGWAEIYSSGGIVDNNGTAINVTANSMWLNSIHGGVAGGWAISMDTAHIGGTGDLSAIVNAGAIYGGIAIRDSSALTPASIYMKDEATYQSTASFTRNGDLTAGTVSMIANEVALISTGAMTLGSSVSLGATAYGSILIGASGNMLLDGIDVFAGDNVDVGLAAGGSMALTNGAYVHGENLVAVAGQEISLAYGSSIGAWQAVALVAGSGIRLEDSYIHSDYSEVEMITGGDIRVNNGSHIHAGNSVYLTLNGSASTVYVNDMPGLNPSHIEAGEPTTVHLDFLNRGSGGVVIDGVATTTTVNGGSGFYANGSPATTGLGGGLEVAYANTDAVVVVDPCVSSPDLCKPPPPVAPIVEVVQPLPPAKPGEQTNTDEDGFGDDEENKKDKKSDETKDGKKDEKSAQKKVAQCSV